MKVPKEARVLLRKRKLARFRWPLETAPRHDGVYALEGEGGGPTEDQFRVIAVAREEHGYSVAALFVDDPMRLLPIAGGGSDDYENEPSIRVMRDEGEAVDKGTQDRFAEEAGQESDSHFTELVDAMDSVRQAVDDRVRDHPQLERYVAHELNAIRNYVRSARRKLNARVRKAA